MNQVFLIACAARKLDQPALAKDLYISPWFRKARAYAEASGAPWYILSAQHGLLNPGRLVEPYNKSLTAMYKPERMAWAVGVYKKICRRVYPPATLVFLAGYRYRQYLLEPLGLAGYTIVSPLAGLGIGQQLAWLDKAIERTGNHAHP